MLVAYIGNEIGFCFTCYNKVADENVIHRRMSFYAYVYK